MDAYIGYERDENFLIVPARLQICQRFSLFTRPRLNCGSIDESQLSYMEHKVELITILLAVTMTG